MAGSWVAFHVTDRCQLDCQHCLRDPAQKPSDLPVSLVERVLDQASRLHRARHASLTGGEPTLHPELAAIVDAIVDRGFDWHLVTNGARFERFLAMLDARPLRRERLTGVNFSVDGAREETHDRIRGAGSFREVLSAVTRAHVRKIPFSMNLTVNAYNVDELEDFAMMATRLGATRAQFNVMQPTGTVHDGALRLELDDWRRVRERVEAMKGTFRITIEGAEGFPVDQPFHVCEPFRSETLHVDPHGRLNLCCQHAGIPAAEGHPSDVVADLAEVSLAEAHARLLGLIHRTQLARLESLASGSSVDWDELPCNACMRHFGKPHWTAEGVGGPDAKRERWRGAWDAALQEQRHGEPRRLPVFG
jgi:MoaA/NifB/PqqE/SkfB family radical SAM enzyme